MLESSRIGRILRDGTHGTRLSILLGVDAPTSAATAGRAGCKGSWGLRSMLLVCHGAKDPLAELCPIQALVTD